MERMSAPYLPVMTEDAPQGEQKLRDVFNRLRWIVRTGAQWRLMPHDLPLWTAVFRAVAALAESRRL